MWEKLKEESGFFFLPGAENVSAVIVNPQGTLNKFNRMGFVAGFGDRRVKIIRRGLVRGEHDENDPRPRYFAQEVSKPGYSESWVTCTRGGTRATPIQLVCAPAHTAGLLVHYEAGRLATQFGLHE